MKRLTTFGLKIIALVTMTLDHIGVFFNIYFLRIIGRVSFPLFAYSLVQGFTHTRNLKKYLLRLGLFALITEPFYDKVFYNTFYHFGFQNIFFTLFLGLLMLLLITTSNKLLKKAFTSLDYYLISLCSSSLIFILFSILAILLDVNYGMLGLALILVFYYFKDNFLFLTISFFIITFILSTNKLQYYDLLALIPIYLYNGKKGKSFKYLFYLYYPLHLLIIYFLKILI